MLPSPTRGSDNVFSFFPPGPSSQPEFSPDPSFLLPSSKSCPAPLPNSSNLWGTTQQLLKPVKFIFLNAARLHFWGGNAPFCHSPDTAAFFLNVSKQAGPALRICHFSPWEMPRSDKIMSYSELSELLEQPRALVRKGEIDRTREAMWDRK